MDDYLNFPADGVAQLPSIILELVFSFLPVKELLLSAQVCWSWKHLIDKTRFWLKKIKRDGIKLLPELEHDLISHDAQDQVITCLKDACKYKFLIGDKNHTEQNFFKDFGDLTDSYDDNISYWTVHEDKISVASALLIFSKPKTVSVRLIQKHSEIPDLILFIKILSHCDCGVVLRDIYSWRTADSTSSELLNILTLENKKCKLTMEFQGSITSLAHLPRSLRIISIILTQDHTSLKSIPGLEKLVTYDESHPSYPVPLVLSLRVHVIAGTNISSLPPLPIVENYGINRTCLFLSKVSETSISWAVETAQRLQYPGSSYNFLLFPKSSLTADNIDNLLESLAAANVQMREIRVDSDADLKNFDTKIFYKRLMPNCTFSFMSPSDMAYIGW
ncbi:unnamed protein product [Meganyctiphanes norvegica]|uniref:F-box domain-containing protein n=1 Tax=Meganyctiphanes norvegica TaxID=48144 RepID=A0AAV2SPW0_MEGNR